MFTTSGVRFYYCYYYSQNFSKHIKCNNSLLQVKLNIIYQLSLSIEIIQFVEKFELNKFTTENVIYNVLINVIKSKLTPFMT